MVSYWKLDGDATDSAGGNDGTIYGATTTTGQIDGALDFDGSNDYVEIPDDDSLEGMDELTISMWVKPDNLADYDCLIHKGNWNGSQGHGFVAHTTFDGTIFWGTYVGTGKRISGGHLSTGVWTFISLWFRGDDEWRIYENGSLDVNTTATVSSIPTTGGNIGIGQDFYGGGTYFNGLIDDVRIYDRALSAEEIEQMYELGLGGHSFYGAPLFADVETSDYHLLSERGRYWPAHDVWVLDDVTSPCIDAGDPNIEPKEELMPNGGRINMGAYGNTAYASMSEWSIFGDINQDGIVDGKDFAIVAGDWLEKAAWKD